ncbi:hypothetical protein [Caulobacter hibisci]|uniref:Uncharacterized protein n=1 Tax=Caulobacter hibisci TaxID=2035993 RepID=A0ABS0T211_9CAUL|nr:hypothetical protein [Caulobacter hibisci]MBI1685140.1 hypothetical protein [Caulobacter hibisci]
MSADLASFIAAAHAAGLGRRLAVLAEDVDRAITEYPAGRDTAYLKRLTGQRRRLLSPDLDLVGAVAADICASDPKARATLAPMARSLAHRFPALTPVARFESVAGGNA